MCAIAIVAVLLVGCTNHSGASPDASCAMGGIYPSSMPSCCPGQCEQDGCCDHACYACLEQPGDGCCTPGLTCSYHFNLNESWTYSCAADGRLTCTGHCVDMLAPPDLSPPADLREVD